MDIQLEIKDIYYLIAILVMFLIFLLWNINLSMKSKKLDRMLNNLSKGNKIDDLDKVIREYTREMEIVKKEINYNKTSIERNSNKITTLKGNLAVSRYNAFGEEGNDLSYSIAFLDEEKNGVVVSSIYNRGESNTYAKPINEGTSTYKLSDEEQDVIYKAMRNK